MRDSPADTAPAHTVEEPPAKDCALAARLGAMIVFEVERLAGYNPADEMTARTAIDSPAMG